MLNQYAVLPFSGPKFNENQDKLKVGENPCAICGKAVAYPYKHVTVVRGGAWAKTEAEAANEADAGYMG